VTVEDHGRKLLEAVLADPDDDGPRLALADWLMERDDPRGEFIAVQCRIAAVEAEVEDGADCDNPTCPACSELRPLRRRERELLELPLEPQSAAFAWSMPLHRTGILLGRPWHQRVTFRRGFVERLTLTAADCLLRLDDVRKRQPVRHVKLTTWPDYHVRGGLAGTSVTVTVRGSDWDRRAEVRVDSIGDYVPALRRGICLALGERWEGVTFALPDRRVLALDRTHDWTLTDSDRGATVRFRWNVETAGPLPEGELVDVVIARPDGGRWDLRGCRLEAQRNVLGRRGWAWFTATPDAGMALAYPHRGDVDVTTENDPPGFLASISRG
jgi:uncharacterized protein (TIGR02996 family)